MPPLDPSNTSQFYLIQAENQYRDLDRRSTGLRGVMCSLCSLFFSRTFLLTVNYGDVDSNRDVDCT
jgi:hypothetical protein